MSFYVDERYLHVELKDGRMRSMPMDWYPELKNATLAQLAAYCFIYRGTGVGLSPEHRGDACRGPVVYGGVGELNKLYPEFVVKYLSGGN